MTFERNKSGLYLPEEYIRSRKPKARPVAVDFFAGCGGMSLGLIKAGWDVIAAFEIDPYAIHTYLTNLGAYPVQMVFLDDDSRERMTKHLEKEINKILAKKPESLDQFELMKCGWTMSGSNRHHAAPDFDGVKYMFIGDVRKLTGEMILDTIGMEIGEIDLVAGGPPCQGFSRSGKHNVMDPRNSLVLDFARLIVELQPKTMLFENVPGILDMVTPEGIPVLDAVSKILSDGNFGEYDALRKCLAETAGCGAALKGGRGTGKGLKASKERHQPEIDRSAGAEQVTLF